MSNVRRVLIPVSTNIEQRRILRALRLLQWKDAEYTLLNIIQLPQPTATYQEVISEMIEENKKILEDISSYFKLHGFDMKVKVAVSRDIVSGIIEEVRRNGYVLIILFRKPRGMFGKISLKLFKSVSQRVLDETTIPVLIMPKE